MRVDGRGLEEKWYEDKGNGLVLKINSKKLKIKVNVRIIVIS